MVDNLYSICWRCSKAGGGCSWSSELIPVQGWRTQRSDIRNDGIQVIECPHFEKESKRKCPITVS